MKFRMHLKVSIITILLVLVSSLTLAVYFGVRVAGNRAAEEGAVSLFNEVSQRVGSRVIDHFSGIVAFAAYGAELSDVSINRSDHLNSPALDFLLAGLENNPSFYSLYYGFEDGAFFQVIAPRGNRKILEKHKAPESCKWIVRSITGAGENRIQKWTFLDSNDNAVGGFAETGPGYDPRVRPWYVGAEKRNDAYLSEAYVFNSLQEPGITVSRKLAAGGGVFGVDLTLEGLNAVVSVETVSEKGGLYLSDGQGRLLANTSVFGSFPALAKLETLGEHSIGAIWKDGNGKQADGLLKTSTAGKSWFARHYTVDVRGRTLGVTIAAPENDFLFYFDALKHQILLIGFLCFLVFTPAGYVFATRMADHVNRLTEEADQVRNQDFKKRERRTSKIIEFDQLLQSFWHMRGELERRNKDLDLEQEKLSRLIELGIGMSAEKNSDKLMEMILLGAKELTNADGGTLYILDEAHNLNFQIVRNNSLGIALGGTTGKAAEIPPVGLFKEGGEPNHSNVVSYAVHQEKSVNIPDAYDTTEFDFSGTRVFDKNNRYKSQSFLTVPLKPRGGNIIGALQLINAQDEESGTIIPFGEEIVSFVEALAAQAATALYNRELLAAQERLMDSLIQLIAGAIDAKSPYTGGHCERVPKLAIMIAEEAGKVTSGHLADFGFNSREEWREFEIGAWLHDCGKVVTPEYVVDKATKLETIFNRIHEVRTRFEVLLRDAEIDRLRAISQGADPGEADKAFDARQQQLFDDFDFVAKSNIGGEFMAEEDIARLAEIAGQTWQRRFDIKKGLSHEEAKRYKDEPDGPCEEKLLSDKALHIIPRDTGISRQYADCNFKVDVPEHLYNYGEVYNLSIQRGTLTVEEHFKIKEHVMQTIVMLEQLPLPGHMGRVPEYAGTHHETIRGSGYPRRIGGEELSVPARIMAIADVFEALTASDRPYKKAKTLSEAVRILSFFKKDNDIDPVIFDLFLTSGVYRQYAEKFLLPEQIDEVDIAAYVDPPPKAS